MRSFLRAIVGFRTAAKLSWHSQRILLAASVVFAPTPLRAHVPFYAKNNTSLETAFHVKEPGKSWVTYGEVAGGQDARWYSFDFESGDAMDFELFVSPDSAPNFVPKLLVAGPGISPSGSLPPKWLCLIVGRIPLSVGLCSTTGRILMTEAASAWF